MVTTAPYGSWSSPITADLLVSHAATVTDVQVADGVTWWSELRPSEGGRIQILRLDPQSGPQDVLPEGWSARTRVHEYGGGAWWVDGPTVFFTSWEDQRLYRIDPGGQPQALTPEPGIRHGLRFADGVLTPDRRWVVCVQEEHRADAAEARNTIVAIAADGAAASPNAPHVLIAGPDFVASPQVSRDGRQLAWISWNHPHMPWDDTELWVAGLSDHSRFIEVHDARREAGGDGQALMQPRWGRHGSLFVISDTSQWWNVCRVDGRDHLTPRQEVNAEVGGPAWVFGLSDVAVDDDGTVVAAFHHEGSAHLAIIPEDGPARDVPLPTLGLRFLRIADGTVTALATRADREPEVVRFPLHDPSAVEVLRAGRDLELPQGLAAEPQHITFPSSEGRQAHAWYFAPSNAQYAPPDGTAPPLLVMTHGGPTSAADPSFSLERLFWTSRGFAVVDVNYGGSTGYGRSYRQLLSDAWGIVDVQDCIAAALYLVDTGRADPHALLIRGGSAGGFTTLAALAGSDVFAAGANSYGVADLGALARDTHKFESRYLDGLVGPWPEAAQIYSERSPLTHVDGFSAPLIVFQGLEDVVVPPAQSEAIVAALDAKGIPHAYLAFEGEQHGFRRAENIVTVTQASLGFFRRVLGLPDPEGLPPVDIAHADQLP